MSQGDWTSRDLTTAMGRRPSGPISAQGDGAAQAPSWSDVLGGVHKNTPPTPEVDPAKLVFLPLYEGQQAIKPIRVTTPTDGLITAALPENLNFQIVRMRVFDGELSDGMGKKPSVTADKTSAPWTVYAHAGQDISIHIRFMPDFKLGKNLAGKKSAQLDVKGKYGYGDEKKDKTWIAKVPIEGRFKGLSLGLIAFPDGTEFTQIRPYPYRPSDEALIYPTAVLINTKEATKGVIVPKLLPPGVLYAGSGPAKFSVATGETVKVELPVKFRYDADAWKEPDGKPQFMIFTVAEGGRTLDLEYYLQLYDGYHIWDWEGDVGSCFFRLALMIRWDGTFRFDAYIRNDDLIFRRDIGFFDVRVGGVGLFSGWGITAPADETVQLSHGWQTTMLQENYLKLLGKSWYVNILVKHPV